MLLTSYVELRPWTLPEYVDELERRFIVSTRDVGTRLETRRKSEFRPGDRLGRPRGRRPPPLRRPPWGALTRLRGTSLALFGRRCGADVSWEESGSRIDGRAGKNGNAPCEHHGTISPLTANTLFAGVAARGADTGNAGGGMHRAGHSVRVCTRVRRPDRARAHETRNLSVGVIGIDPRCLQHQDTPRFTRKPSHAERSTHVRGDRSHANTAPSLATSTILPNHAVAPQCTASHDITWTDDLVPHSAQRRDWAVLQPS